MTPLDSLPDQPIADEQLVSDDPEETVDPEEVAELLAEYRWAPGQPEEKLFANMIAAEEEFFEYYEAIGMIAMSRLAYRTYYGLGGSSNQFETQSIRFAGDDDERVEYLVNEFRSFADQIFNMTIKNRPAFQAQAINTDARTLGSIEASDTIVKYFYEQVFGERKEKEVVKAEGIYGKSYTYLDWDPNAGDDVEIDEPVDDPRVVLEPIKKLVKSGKFVISRKFWWDVPCDVLVSEHDEHQWRIVIENMPLHDMIAKYPLYARAIKGQVEKAECTYARFLPGPTTRVDKDSGKVMVRTLLHGLTPALPEGRKAVFVGTKLVADGPLPIETIPVVDFMSCELDQTCIGMSDLWNLIPEQQMNNQVLSDIATNVEAFGRPPLGIVEGTDLDIDALANGQKFMMIPSVDQMPQVVQFPRVDEVSIQLVELNRKFMQALSGLNGIARGESEASVKSGAHAALYHAMAVENQTARSANLDLHRERVTNIILQYLKKYAKHPQLVAIAGEDERPYLQYLTQKDIAGIHRVVCKTANPLMRTQAGRMSVAELLRDWPGQPLKDPAEIIELIVSGQYKPLYSPMRAESMRIKRENEALSTAPKVQELPGELDPKTGEKLIKKTVPDVPVLATDNAQKHIVKHLELLSAPDTVSNFAKLDAVLTHVMEHVEMARTGDAYLAQLLGNPPPEMAAPPPEAGPAPPGEEGSASGKEGPSDVDMQRAQQATAKPGSQGALAEEDDSQGAFGRVPKPAKPPIGPGN